MPPSCLSAADKNWCGNFADIGSAGYPRTKIMGGATAAQAFAFHAFVDCDLLPNQSRRGREPRLIWQEIAINESVKREGDRKSTRLKSSHDSISYAVFRLKKKIEK